MQVGCWASGVRGGVRRVERTREGLGEGRGVRQRGGCSLPKVERSLGIASSLQEGLEGETGQRHLQGGRDTDPA